MKRIGISALLVVLWPFAVVCAMGLAASAATFAMGKAIADIWE